MASDIPTASDGGDDARGGPWIAGVAGGVIGGIVVGLLIQLALDPAIITEGLPSVLGTTGPAAGWLVLLGFGALAGLVYAAIATMGGAGVGIRAARPNTGAVVGLLYGLVLWLLFALGMAAAGGPTAPGTYPLTLLTAVTFGLFGVVLGIGYGAAPATGP